MADTKNSKMETKVEEPDKMTKAIGVFGKWQVMLLLLIAFPTRMSSTWHQLGILFIAPQTKFICTKTNLTNSIEMNTCYSDCVSYDYFTEFKNTIISEWQLICDKAWLTNFTQLICMLGVLVGSSVFGYIADRFGRRPALLISCMLQLVTALAEAFCPTYWLFATVRFFVGAATAGVIICSFILMMEIVGPLKRELMNCLCCIPIAVGQMLMPLFSFYLRTWNNFCLGIAIPHLLYLAYFYILPESPKWLVSVGKLEEASKVMTQAAKWNNLPSNNLLDVAKSMANEKVNSNEPIHKATFMDLLKTRPLRINILCSCFLWFILGMSFYGITQYMGQSTSNVFIYVAFAATLQFPGILLSGVLCKYIGRKITIIGFFIICGVSNALLLVPNDTVRLTMGAIGSGCSAAAYTTMYVYTTELFPTVTRNMAMGASSTTSRVGSILAPYVASMTILAAWLPPVAFAIVPMLGAIVTCVFLQETRGKTLPDHLS